MITVTVEQKQGSPKGATTRRIRVSASSIKRALEICGAERPDTDGRAVFPIEAESFFAPVENTSCGYMLPVEASHRNLRDNIAAKAAGRRRKQSQPISRAIRERGARCPPFCLMLSILCCSDTSNNTTLRSLSNLRTCWVYCEARRDLLLRCEGGPARDRGKRRVRW